MSLSGFDSTAFLRNYWQQKPLFIRQGLPDYHCPIDGNELAGLACEEEVESRLIAGRDTTWHIQNGPFDEATFDNLPPSHWTLLVQRVDHWAEEIAGLIRHFDFLPQWRIEDIMISYAVTGGGVGPHFDRYDVFLIQGSGQREWKLGQSCDDSEPMLCEQPMRLLESFREVESHVLNPGDILYVPPGTAHWGTALTEDCITLSVGFRAPSLSQILERWWDTLSSQLTEDQRYRDSEATLAAGHALTQSHIAHLQALLRDSLLDEYSLVQSFGELVTEPAGDILPQSQPREVPRASVYRALDSRLTTYQAGSELTLFANGMSTVTDAGISAVLAEICAMNPGEMLPDALWLSLVKASPEAASFLLSTGALEADA